MEVPVQITLRDMKPSAALTARIRGDAGKLERLHPEIMSCRVVIEEADRHRRRGREFSVRIEVRVAGREALVSTRRHDDDVYVAVRDAFEAVRSQFG